LISRKGFLNSIWDSYFINDIPSAIKNPCSELCDVDCAKLQEVQELSGPEKGGSEQASKAALGGGGVAQGHFARSVGGKPTS
jgi:hypothetical protein